jgi:hypothetical protein
MTIASGIKWQIAQPHTLQRNFAALQRWRGYFGQRTLELLMQLEIDQHRIAIVGMTPMGNRLFALIYQNGKLSYEPEAQFNSALRPEYLLADLQLCLWPTQVLQQHLSGSNMKLVESQPKMRDIQRHNQTIIRIQYTKTLPQVETITFQHLERAYRFELHTLQTFDLKKDLQTDTKKHTSQISGLCQNRYFQGEL